MEIGLINDKSDHRCTGKDLKSGVDRFIGGKKGKNVDSLIVVKNNFLMSKNIWEL